MVFLRKHNIYFIGLTILAIFAIANISVFTNNFYLFLIPVILCSAFYWLAYLFRTKAKDRNFRLSKNKYLAKIQNYLSLKDNQVLLSNQVLAVILNLLLIVRYMWAHDYLEGITGLQSELMNPFEVTVSAVLNPLFIGAILLIVISQFVNSKVFNQIVKFISTPIILLSTVFFVFVLNGVVGQFTEKFDIRSIFMVIELGLSYFFIVQAWFNDSSFRMDSSDIKVILIVLLLLLITGINAYLPNTLFGQIRHVTNPHDLNSSHRVFILLAFLLPILYFILLYRFDNTHRRALLAFISFMALFSYSSIYRFEIFTDVGSLPLHLCNTAMYIVPLTLIFKNHFVFYFTMFINVIGAFIALMMPNYTTSLNIFSPSVMVFYINHLYAFFMPILIVLLGIYERPKLKYFIYSMIGFLAYYILVLFVDVYYTAYFASIGSNRVIDFFFINSSFVADKLGQWAQNIFNVSLNLEINGLSLSFRPGYQVAFFIIYVLLALGMWYVYEALFKGVDNLTTLYEKNKAFKDSQLTFIMKQKEKGMKMKKEKINFESLPASVEITHLTKRYGNNEKNAVTDFSLKLEKGHIYGFLGKNGAGKSTIIKSIVGMHSFNEGSIAVCGFDVEHQPIEAKECIGFVPDHYALYENLTGRQYINYIADLYNVSLAKRTEILDSLCKKLDMVDHIDHQMKTYSHGMKQKITIIGALIHEPKIWILDEPMTGLDPNSIFQIKECMREHAKKGNIVFFSSHLIDVVSNLCDEIIIIKHGQFVQHCVLSSLREEGISLEKLFLEKTADSQEELNLLENEEKKEEILKNE